MSIHEQYASFFSMVQIVREIVIADQYCAQEFIKDDAIVIDVGANIGIFSLFAHSLASNGKIYSFEPSSQTFRTLQKNILDNNLEKEILLFQKAIGENKKEVKLLTSPLDQISTIENSDFAKSRYGLFSSSENVQMISIDCFISENNIKRVDFIKMDIEGYERQAIRGAENTIKKFSPTIVCSAYHLKDDKIKIPLLVKSINPDYKHRLEKRGEETLVFWTDEQ